MTRNIQESLHHTGKSAYACTSHTYLPYVIHKSWLRGVFHLYTTQTEARGHLQRLRLGAYALQTSEGRGLGSYMRGIHKIIVIHVIYMLIAWCKDTIFYQVVYMRYIYTTCASIGQWPPLVYMYSIFTALSFI